MNILPLHWAGLGRPWTEGGHRRYPTLGYPKIWILKALIHTPTSLSLLATPRGRSCESNRRVVLDFNTWCIGPACLQLVSHRLPGSGELLAGVSFSSGQKWRLAKANPPPPAPRARLGMALCATHPCRGTRLQPSGASIPDKHQEPGGCAWMARKGKGREANHSINFSS